MATWLEVATVAFVAQLSVLPGEKAQFVVAALSTRFDPLLVTAAAGTAFAGWTAVEVAVGQALTRAVPQVYLDAMTGLLFLGFAVLLVRSAPDGGRADAAPGSWATTDGGVVAGTAAEDLDVTVPYLGTVPTWGRGFLPVFVLMAVGEVGDKTQLVTIGLATQFAHGTAIWAGEMAAIVPVSLLNAVVFSRASRRFDLRRAHLVGAVLFLLFGLDTLQSLVTGVSIWETVVSWVAASAGAAVSVP